MMINFIKKLFKEKPKSNHYDYHPTKWNHLPERYKQYGMWYKEGEIISVCRPNSAYFRDLLQKVLYILNLLCYNGFQVK